MNEFQIERDAAILAAKRDRDIDRMGSDTISGLIAADIKCDKRIEQARTKYTYMLHVHGI